MQRWHLVTEDFPPGFVGGIASWASDLASALASAGESVIVHARHTSGTKAHDSALPYEVRRMRGRHWSRWGSRWAQFSVSSAVNPGDRVITSSWRLMTHSLGILRRRKATFAITFHGSDLTQLKAASAPLHSVVAAAQALLPASTFLGTELERLGLVNEADRRVRTLPIPLPKMPQRTHDGSGLICVARPTALKGIDRVRSLARALDVPLTLVGPPIEDGGTGIIARDAVHEAMSRAAAAVLLPNCAPDGRGAEGLGIVLLEAAAMGVPVIGCHTGGVPEAVGPGLLIDPDTPDLDAVRQLLGDPQAGTAAQAWVRQAHGPEQAVHVLMEAMG